MKVRAGVSLSETILAMILVATVLLVVVNMFPQALWSTRMQEHRVLAGELARSTLREAASQAIWPDPGIHELPPVTRDNLEFTRTVEAIPLPGTDPAVYLQLRAQVNWRSLTGQPQQLVRELGVCRLPAR